MAGYPHPQNLIHENLDLTASREIYMLRKFPGIQYCPPTVLVFRFVTEYIIIEGELYTLAIV